MNAVAVGIRLVSLEVRGFRAFGTEARVLQMDAPLVVVHAGNSQGKTSLAEAVEFLVSGRSSRRDLLGGAKAEYNDSLRNAHMPVDDSEVYVAATLRGTDGATHQIRRELVCDFGPGSECESRLLLDGIEVDDLDSVGVVLADPPMRAPVLLQHTLRHVLSTEPKQRVGYFKALLALTDLDVLRDRIRAARTVIEGEQSGSALRLVGSLAPTPAAAAGTAIIAMSKKPVDAATAGVAVNAALRAAATAVLEGSSGTVDELHTARDLQNLVERELQLQHESLFPLSAFAPNTESIGAVGGAPELGTYTTALEGSDHRVTKVAPLFQAVLAIDELSSLDTVADCPVCGTENALTAERIALLREHLLRTKAIDSAARAAAGLLDDARRELERRILAVDASVSAVAGWSSQQVESAHDALSALGADPTLITQAHAAAVSVAAAAGVLSAAIDVAREQVSETIRSVAGREPVRDDLTAAFAGIAAAKHAYDHATNMHHQSYADLRIVVDVGIREQIEIVGLRELADLLARRDDLVADLVTESNRQALVRRIAAAEKALREAAARLVDTRFAQMSDTITAWWTTIRPEELVSFGGIKRRAGGALFVNLVAALRADPGSDPVEREALGVYSDSQLNALGLSIFLARADLMSSPIVVLDDPIPGSDADHRLTFVQNTLGKLLDSGTQVILTTYDSKLCEWSQANHDWRGSTAYELNLLDVVAGTQATQTADTFSRLLLEAEENLNAPTPRGRRAACGSYRSAAERLAKQIVATGRTHDGTPTSVEDVDNEAAGLGKLVPLVNGYALDNAEKGRWRTFANVLNPGNHDDDVPSTAELKQVRGDLRKIAKVHRAHWPNGLLL